MSGKVRLEPGKSGVRNAEKGTDAGKEYVVVYGIKCNTKIQGNSKKMVDLPKSEK